MFAFRRYLLLLSLLPACAFLACNRQPEEKVVDLKQTETTDKDARLKALSEAISRNPKDPAAYEKRAGLYLDLQQPDQALADANQAISLDSTRAMPYYVKARALRASRQVPAAIKMALKAEDKGLDDPGLYLATGEMFLIMKQYQRAIDYLNKSLKIAQFNEQAYYYKGLVYAESGDTTRAISSMQTAIEQDPAFMDAYNSLIKIYNARKDYKMARQYITSGLRFGPEDPALWVNRGVLFQGMGQPDSAANCFRKALELKPGLAVANYNLGAIAYQKDQYAEAIPLLEQVIESPDQGGPYTEVMLAQSYEKTGQSDRAHAYYQKAVQLFPEDVRLQEGLQRTQAGAGKTAAAVSAEVRK